MLRSGGTAVMLLLYCKLPCGSWFLLLIEKYFYWHWKLICSETQDSRNTDSWVMFVIMWVTIHYWIDLKKSIIPNNLGGAGQKNNLALYVSTFCEEVCVLIFPVYCCRNTTLSGLVNGVAELINFVGRISAAALCLEKSHTFLLYFILDFYETVCVPSALFFKMRLFAFFFLAEIWSHLPKYGLLNCD